MKTDAEDIFASVVTRNTNEGFHHGFETKFMRHEKSKVSGCETLPG